MRDGHDQLTAIEKGDADAFARLPITRFLMLARCLNSGAAALLRTEPWAGPQSP